VLLTADSSGTFVIASSPWMLMAYTAFFVAGVVTATKGRWGWLFAGLLFGGVIWPVTAFLPATPRSAWRMLRRRRASAR
jgi:threonine/homoserine/homoserine lactone efflux protein